MPSDQRSRRIVFVAHCLLNQNAKVAGLAAHPGVVAPVVEVCARLGVGVIQMACPEVAEFGLGRVAGTDTRGQYDTPKYRDRCRRIAHDVVSTMSDYRANGVDVLCLLGVEGSPSCSVDRVPVLEDGGGRRLVRGYGIFMEALSRELEGAGLEIPLIGIPESDEAGDLRTALARLERALDT